MIHLETERLILRDLLRGDLYSHHRLLSDETAMRYLSDIQTHSLDESERNLEQAIADQGNPDRTLYFLGMEEQATGQLVGEIGYTVTAVAPVGKLVHLGYFSFSRYWGKGYMTEALRETLRFAFEENGVYRVSTGCLKDNVGSERVMQKCGMVQEADRVDSEWWEGTLHTRVEYRLLREEWQRSR